MPPTRPTRDAPRSVDLAEVHARLRAGEPHVLLDVRELGETALGVIPGATCVPLSELEATIRARVPELATPLVVYCATGVRSARGARLLLELGYRDVGVAPEGFEAWRARGLPVSVPEGTPVDAERYARHLSLPEVGPGGQARLSRARVALVGAGGLGSPIALYLAAAGVGHLCVVDDDVVALSNLQRQVLHTTSEVGERKVASAARAILALNPLVRVEPLAERVREEAALRLASGFDVVIDASDNFATRYVLSDACAAVGKPLVHGSVFRFEGQVTVFDRARGGPCYRCLHPAPPPPGLAPACGEAGVLGVVPGLVGMLQAVEALKLLLEIGEPLVGRLLHVDALTMRFSELRLARDPDCPTCARTEARPDG